MLLEGKDLFPLTHLENRFSGYYMDSFHYIYSTRKHNGKVTKLVGTMTDAGHYYTLDGIMRRADDLAKSARAHSAWGKEVGGGDRILNQIRERAQAKRAEIAKSAVAVYNPPFADRNYAVSMELAIKGRAVIIASINGDALVFGTNPKLHIGEKSWKAEMTRLASVAPGTKFVALQIVASVVAGGVQWE